SHTAQPSRSASATGASGTTPGARQANVQDRLAGWITDLTSLHELTERLAATETLDDALQEVLSAGAALIGARRGFLALETPGGAGTERTFGLGLGRAELGQIETVPRSSSSYARLLDGGRNERPAGQRSGL